MAAPWGDESDILMAVSSVLRGDSRAFSTIVERYEGIVFRLALSYLGSPEEAEDATQEIFLKIYGSLGRFRLDRRFHPWMYTVALNHLRSRHRRLLRFRARRADSRDPDTLASPPGEDPLDAEARGRVREAIRSLPGNLREVVVLYYLEGMDTAGAAEVLGIGVENVKSRLHRARARLRGLLAEEGR